MRETYANGHLSNLAHVASKHNLANIFTKEKDDSTMLRDLMTQRKYTLPDTHWILTQ